jgi:hypothetical protein
MGDNRDVPADRSAEPASPSRRRTVIALGVVGLVVLGAVTTTVVGSLQRSAAVDRPLSGYGVPVAEAGCGPVLTDPGTGVGDTVGPGTAHPDQSHVDYPTNPPSHGPHLATPSYPNLPFYTVHDVPAVERLVHNLEHGYTIAWYDPGLPQPTTDELRDLATKIRVETTPKFMAAPWDTTRGPLPAGAAIALSHWGSQHGYRQYCAALSGQAVQDFVLAHPASDSPEPDAP